MIGVVRMKGYVQTSAAIRETMQMLRLDRINHMVAVHDTPTVHGMLKKAEFLVTWGPLDAKTLGRVLEKRGRLAGDKALDAEFLKKNKAKDFEELAKQLMTGKTTLKALLIKPVFRLHPPRKGFGRQGVKKSFSVGGASGNRDELINGLIQRMC
ncbi:MAG: 50S ribosomal protein L30 [Candidatus Diapherotrites archaeon]|nr:50S ribosomal protein L30 [Candidatus Diapherotrites archaeon]